jgi:hypothetical protein
VSASGRWQAIFGLASGGETVENKAVAAVIVSNPNKSGPEIRDPRLRKMFLEEHEREFAFLLTK